MLSAFRPKPRCQTAFLKIVEDWKRTLDDNKYIAAILMDLSKETTIFLFRERYFFYIKEMPELLLDLQEISKNL
jgi:hypothetical protein